MTNAHIIDGRFTEGLYYEVETGDIIGFDINEEEELIVITDPEGDELDEIDPVDFDEGGYYAVAEEAIEDPARFFGGLISKLIDLDQLDISDYAGYMYASDRTEIVNADRDPALDHWIGTEAGQVHKRFESWDQAKEYRQGHARDVFSMPRLEEADE